MHLSMLCPTISHPGYSGGKVGDWQIELLNSPVWGLKLWSNPHSSPCSIQPCGSKTVFVTNADSVQLCRMPLYGVELLCHFPMMTSRVRGLGVVAHNIERHINISQSTHHQSLSSCLHWGHCDPLHSPPSPSLHTQWREQGYPELWRRHRVWPPVSQMRMQGPKLDNIPPHSQWWGCPGPFCWPSIGRIWRWRMLPQQTQW